MLISIYVVPSDEDLNILEGYDPQIVGTEISDDSLKLNQVKNGYSIIYGDETFICFDLKRLAYNTVSTFSQNTEKTDVKLYYLYNIANSDEWFFESETALKFMKFAQDIQNLSKDNNVVNYLGIANEQEFLQDYFAVFSETHDIGDGNYREFDEIVEPEGEPEFDYIPETPFKEIHPRNDPELNQHINDIMSYMVEDDYDDEDDDKKKKDKKKKGKKKSGQKSYDKVSESKIVKNAKNPKRDYKRHGVVISKNKNHLKSDEKTIENFLKGFIPGDGWKKDFRKDVLKRWIRSYSISTKNLKRMEKQVKREKMKSKYDKNYAAKSRNVTRLIDQVLNRSVEEWYNPKK